MAGINKLTAMQVKKAKPGTKLQDGGGLIFEATSAGGKWIYRFSINKRRREMGLGSMPQVSLSDARKERDRWVVILNSGIDPIEERERLRAEAEAAANEPNDRDPTFKDMVEIVFEAQKERLREDGERGRWLSPLKVHVLPKIGSKRISELDRFDIKNALEPIWRTKQETASKAYLRTKKVLTKARRMGYDVDPFICDQAEELLGFVENKSKPITSTPWQELPSLYLRLSELDYPSSLAVRFAILTTARGMSVRGARFDEIDGDVWTVPADRMKGERGQVKEFRIPLSTEALAVLRQCKENARSDFLFPSPRANKGVSDVAMSKVLNVLKEPGRVHGFRSSFRTWVQDTDAASYEVAETALAHTVGNKVERAYARSDLLDHRRILMQKWADYVTGVEAKVIPLRGAG